MRQVEDYVRPCLTSRVPTICMFLSSLFQDLISNFAGYMLLKNDTLLTKNLIGNNEGNLSTEGVFMCVFLFSRMQGY